MKSSTLIYAYYFFANFHLTYFPIEVTYSYFKFYQLKNIKQTEIWDSDCWEYGGFSPIGYNTV